MGNNFLLAFAEKNLLAEGTEALLKNNGKAELFYRLAYKAA